MLALYGTSLSSPTNKVRFVANYLQLSYQFHNVNLAAGEHLKAEFLTVNPAGKIPAIEDNGFCLAESNVIIRYLARQHDSALLPKDFQQQAIVEQWMDFSAMHIASATSKVFMNTHVYKVLDHLSQDLRTLKESRLLLERYLPVVEKQLAAQPYIAGDTLSLADFSLLSALDVAEVIELDLSIYHKLFAWRKKHMAEAYYQNCHENFAATFEKVMAMFNLPS